MKADSKRANVISSNQGFTLVELLVVIGIIALLIGVLLPALGKARESANTAKCLANLHQLGIAFRMYENDFHNYPPPVEYCSSTGADLSQWFNILVDRRYLKVPDSTGKLSPITQTVLYCPSSSSSDLLGANAYNPTVPSSRLDARGGWCDRWQSSELQANGKGITVDDWYGANGMDLFIGTTSGAPLRKTYDGSEMVKMSYIRQASNMVALFDGCWWHLSYNANRIHSRHNKGTLTNIMFFDGHAASYRTADLPGGNDGKSVSTSVFSLPSLQAARRGGVPIWDLGQQ